ncbi:MAG TPA: CoA-binding protein [Terriglobales bacterium]|nr:CoA-binding protein [Terriglobales bacterium]
MPTTIADVREFLAQRRIALVGVSRNPKDFSRMLFREMCDRGYDMVPVNPAVSEVESRRCFGRLQEIDPPAEGALVMTAPQDTERVVRDCVEAGVRRVWMHRGGDKAPSVMRLPTSAIRTGYTWLKAIARSCFFPIRSLSIVYTGSC